MRCWLYIVAMIGFLGCNSNGVKTEQPADSAYKAITDTSQVTQDSLAIPDSSARSLTH